MSAPGTEVVSTRCCVVGGGPAGIMTGYLLARLGVDVIVLEKHGDFLRDFRGDTIHPSTLEVMGELGLLGEFLRLPHQPMQRGTVSIGGKITVVADLSGLPVRCPYIAIMPQWDFLNFLADKGRSLTSFRLRLKAEATDLRWNGGRVAGVTVQTPAGELHIQSDLVIGADGRNSIVREKAGFTAHGLGAPIDVLWTRLPKSPDVREQALGYVDRRKLMVLIDRGDYFQTGFVIAKGGFDQIKAAGLPNLREEMGRLAPFLRDALPSLQSWDQIKLLTVRIDRLPKWHRAGLLCIGDCAHAMSPAGGVGVNYAVQDAVATANLLGSALRRGPVSEAQLARIQRRREWPVRIIQRLQLIAHRRMFLGADGPPLSGPPLALRLLSALPGFQGLVGRLIGLGPRPEHIRIDA